MHIATMENTRIKSTTTKGEDINTMEIVIDLLNFCAFQNSYE